MSCWLTSTSAFGIAAAVIGASPGAPARSAARQGRPPAPGRDPEHAAAGGQQGQARALVGGDPALHQELLEAHVAALGPDAVAGAPRADGQRPLGRGHYRRYSVRRGRTPRGLAREGHACGRQVHAARARARPRRRPRRLGAAVRCAAPRTRPRPRGRPARQPLAGGPGGDGQGQDAVHVRQADARRPPVRCEADLTAARATARETEPRPVRSRTIASPSAVRRTPRTSPPPRPGPRPRRPGRRRPAPGPGAPWG
jgi:hypothetical protein